MNDKIEFLAPFKKQWPSSKALVLKNNGLGFKFLTSLIAY
jgi:hypothetical protein